MDQNWLFTKNFIECNNLNYYDDISVKTFLRFNYFNNGLSDGNCFFDTYNHIELHKKYSSKKISDYYKGFSIVKDGIYEGHLVDPSSLHIWDSTYENTTEILDLRQCIICNINGIENNNKICLPIKFNNIFYNYIQVGEKPLPILSDALCDSSYGNLINEFLYSNYSFPKIELNLFDIPWYLKHFPIFVNPIIYKNPLDCDYAKMIYFYYQRQNPYVQKAYTLSNEEYLFCDFSFGINEKHKNIKNKFGIYFYGLFGFPICCSLLNNSISATYDSTEFYCHGIGSLITSSYYCNDQFISKTINQNTIFTYIDKQNNIFDFQQCSYTCENNLCIDFLSCKNNFLILDLENAESCSDIWYNDYNLIFKQNQGLPNLDLTMDTMNKIISSDFLNETHCNNVII